MRYASIAWDRAALQLSARKLKIEVEDIMKCANPAEIKGPVNWASLSVVGVLLDVCSRSWVVKIEEASPDATGLCRYIETVLEERGWPDVSVESEW